MSGGMARVNAVLDGVVGDVVLDLGAVQHDAENAERDDWLHEHLVQEVERVIGVDILADDVERLREQGYEFVVGDVEELDLEYTVDTIVAGELIEHLSNPGKMLESCADHLVDGGRLIITTPNPWAFVWVRRAARGRVDPNPEHTAWFGPDVIEELLSRYGFESVDIQVTAPVSGGVSWLLYRLGFEYLGGTHLVIVAEYSGGGTA